jgi:uncharacterized protein
MPVQVNLRHLEAHPVHLEGEIAASDLDIETRDEVIQLAGPLRYNLEVQKLEGGLLVQGRLSLILECQCVRCLKRFQRLVQLDLWTSHLPFQGEDAIPVVNDCVDLTPWVREDILLEFPQHPLCERDCGGLANTSGGKSKNLSKFGPAEAGSPAWQELNKLKF